MKNFLPLGSVVKLKGAEKRLMICGRVQSNVETNKLYDYSACLFPEGIIDPEELYLFDNEDIEMIYFLGLQDVEEFEYRDFMEEKLKEIGEKLQ